ncbi:NYNRIN-like [Solea senegalensis]|uniref:NYNRIN-like n=1 Tax=Solea senegalensis TaxID=28829 RepID=A0AAV6T398_SOLSE|nr:NYNRIN-like [Solea senegalensis]
MTAILTKPVRLDLGVIVLTEPFWYLPDNSEGTVLGMDIMEKHGFVIHCLEKQIEVITDKTAKKKSVRNCESIMSITTPDPVQQVINKHSDAWANHEHDCGLIGFEVSIEGTPPPPQKQYKIKPEAEAAVHDIVKELEVRGIVRQCSSAANSPCLPVPKASGKRRLCIDYQHLSKALPKATPIVANPARILTKLPDNAALFSVLDINNGFWSIKVNPKDQRKLAFTFNHTQFTWQRMPQGLHISPGAFHKAVSDILSPHANTGEVVSYVDDILIKQQFWWPAMTEDVDSWCASGLVCAAYNQGKPGHTKLCRPNPPKGLREALQMDFIGPLPSAKGGIAIVSS